jgi:hypothetical protein
MAQLQTRQLKLTRDMAQLLARGGEQIHPALGEFPRLGPQAACLITLHVQLEAVPPPHPVLGRARPCAKRVVLPGTSDVSGPLLFSWMNIIASRLGVV